MDLELPGCGPTRQLAKSCILEKDPQLLFTFIFLSQLVQLETSGLLAGQTLLRVGWRSATTMHGAQYVMTHGELLMLMWPVDS